ncbi:regulatory protein [Streptomyces viridosporus ATCC 14672]|uniref:Regulatory protein n=1 Tax=Streptomyces viridosporus (strain ATCC 14672 / DSM 40746 / JCM 4963 / KCTC 9882 / NRRL B-12104 / FH 1290) TaxID=566461 RepID=D6A9B4_STRV1|nr:regulatory protein [Streptomyces viridosporus ATCC 14672]
MAHSGTSWPHNRCIMFLHVQDPGGWRFDYESE